MSAKKCLLFGSVVLLTLAGSRSGEAQVVLSYPYPAPYRYGIGAESNVRLDIAPKDAEVFVDGYYAGVVDDFDGVFQRLHAAPGAHDITVYREGYRTLTEHVYLMPNGTLKIKSQMDRLAPGETAALPPQPVELPANAQAGPPAPPREPFGRRVPPPVGAPLPDAPQPPPAPLASDQPASQSASGTLSLRVQPADADILIDGTLWRAPQGSDPSIVDLPEGHHTLQVRKAGYVAYLTDVQIRRGETTPFVVSLRTNP